TAAAVRGSARAHHPTEGARHAGPAPAIGGRVPAAAVQVHDHGPQRQAPGANRLVVVGGGRAGDEQRLQAILGGGRGRLGGVLRRVVGQAGALAPSGAAVLVALVRDDQLLPWTDGIPSADAVGVAEGADGHAVVLGDLRERPARSDHVHLRSLALLPRRGNGELLSRADRGAPADAVGAAERVDAHVVALGDRAQ